MITFVKVLFVLLVLAVLAGAVYHLGRVPIAYREKKKLSYTNNIDIRIHNQNEGENISKMVENLQNEPISYSGWKINSL